MFKHKLILSGFAFVSVALIVQMKLETNRVNVVTDLYMTSLAKSAWMIGCAQGTKGSYAYCDALAEHMDFNKLKKDLDKANASKN